MTQGSGVSECRGHRSTDKRYAGDNGLIGVKSSHLRSVWHLDVGSSHPRGCKSYNVSVPLALGEDPNQFCRRAPSVRPSKRLVEVFASERQKLEAKLG